MSAGGAVPTRVRAARWAFGVYAVALFTATHWPQLRAPELLPRTDLWLHAAAFFGWASLAIASSLFGPRLSDRNLLRTFLLGVAYAGVDEGLQAIPALNRFAEFGDFGANTIGVTAAVAAATVLAWRAERRAS